MLEALRAYAQVAAGLAEPAAARARDAARALLEVGGATGVTGTTGTTVSALAEELLAVARSNRELLLDVVRTEVRSSVGRLGLVDAATLDALRRRVVTLEREVEGLRAPRATKAASKKAATRKSATKKVATKKTATKKTATKKTATKAASRSSSGQSSGRTSGRTS